MAYRSNLLDEEDQKGIAPSTSSSGVFTAQGSTGTPQSNQAATPTSSPTGFTNLQAYLGQNQNVGGIATAAAGTTGQKEYESRVGGQAQQYGQEAQKAGEAATKTAQELSTGLTQKPLETTQQAGEFLGQSYSGPKADTFGAKVAAEQAGQEQKLATLGTTAGQQTALQSAFQKQGQYTKPYSVLDQFLMAGNPEARASLEAQRQQQVTEAKKAGTGAQEQLKAQQKAAEDQFKKQQEAVKTTAKTEQEKRKQTAEQAIGQKELENLTKRGYQRASYGDVMSDQQIADLEALAQISGESIADLKSKTFTPGTIPESQGGFERQAPGTVPKMDRKVKIPPELEKLKNRLGL
jgi:hypothetical protein